MSWPHWLPKPRPIVITKQLVYDKDFAVGRAVAMWEGVTVEVRFPANCPSYKGDTETFTKSVGRLVHGIQELVGQPNRFSVLEIMNALSEQAINDCGRWYKTTIPFSSAGDRESAIRYHKPEVKWLLDR